MQMVVIRKLQQLQYQTKETQDKNITGGKETFYNDKGQNSSGGPNNQKCLCFNNGS